MPSSWGRRWYHYHLLFRGLAARGKTSVDWFFGFKLHLVFNDRGEVLTFTLTPGNLDDRAPVPHFAQRLFGKLFGDKGYLSQPLLKQLKRLFGIELITARRRNMKKVELPLLGKLRLRKRAIVETIIDQLKNILQIEHTRHRSPIKGASLGVCIWSYRYRTDAFGFVNPPPRYLVVLRYI